jgi:hypothetical protein
MNFDNKPKPAFEQPTQTQKPSLFKSPNLSGFKKTSSPKQTQSKQTHKTIKEEKDSFFKWTPVPTYKYKVDDNAIPIRKEDVFYMETMKNYIEKLSYMVDFLVKDLDNKFIPRLNDLDKRLKRLEDVIII